MLLDANVAIENVYRSDWGRIVAALIRLFADFDFAEEVAQEAFAAAVAQWRCPASLKTRAHGSSRRPGTKPSIASGGRRHSRKNSNRMRFSRPVKRSKDPTSMQPTFPMTASD